MEAKFGCMTIPQLRAELKKRNARLAGRKHELVERLVAYDRNQDFGRIDVMEPDFKMALPDPSTYCDVNSDTNFNGTDMTSIEHYLVKFDKELGSNVKSLYDERFLKIFRVSFVDQFMFVKAISHAEMKKTVCYGIDIKFSCGGSILEAQCECAAGMGPGAHCKHVCTVLYGAAMFKEKSQINTEETCTQKLQSFHKCKNFVGSPIKTTGLNMPGADEITNIENFDPRPEQYRNSIEYQDHYRNVCLNLPGISNMPIFQTFEPANNRAVAHDHDYLSFMPEDTFLHNINVTKISQNQIKEIEQRTVGQSKNKYWLDERTKRLTASMFGKLCKATDKTDKIKLARSLTVYTVIKAAPLEHGRQHENICLQRYTRDTGNHVYPCGLVISYDFPFLASSPDGMINRDHIIEVKCPYTSRSKKISPTSVPYLKCDSNENMTLQKNHDYFYQIQGQLLCTGASRCTLAVCTASDLCINDIVYVDIYRDDTFIAKMVEELRQFFDSYFKPELLEKHFYKSYKC